MMGTQKGTMSLGGPRNASQWQCCLHCVSKGEWAYSEPAVELNVQFSCKNNGSWEINVCCLL